MLGVYRNPNTPTIIASALGTPDRPISLDEFQEFWKSLTEDEKDFYRRADLH